MSNFCVCDNFSINLILHTQKKAFKAKQYQFWHLIVGVFYYVFAVDSKTEGNAVGRASYYVSHLSDQSNLNWVLSAAPIGCIPT